MGRGSPHSRSLDLPRFKKQQSPPQTPTSIDIDRQNPRPTTTWTSQAGNSRRQLFSKTMDDVPTAPAPGIGLIAKIKHPIRLLRQNFVENGSRGSTDISNSVSSLNNTNVKAAPNEGSLAQSTGVVDSPITEAASPSHPAPFSAVSLGSTMQSGLSQDTIVEESDLEPANELYGRLTEPFELSTIAEVAKLSAGADVAFRARITTQRRISASLDFLLLRDQTNSIQGVLSHAPVDMIKWVQHLPLESLVQVTGILKKPVGEVRSATNHGLEVAIHTLHLVNASHDVPFDNYKPVAGELVRHRLENRVLDLRHPSNQAIFRVRSTVARKFRETLDELGFLEIHTPKLQPAATESGAQVFKVNYFGRNAFLAQSPQLAKQMAICADFGRVFEVRSTSPSPI